MKSTKFFIRILAVFFTLVKPASTSAKPGCMKNTSMAASSIHTVFSPLVSSPTVSGVAMAVLSVVEVACANISVVKQNAMDMARAIRSL